MRPILSVVAPAHNEAPSLPELHRRLTEVLTALALPFEIIYVDDGSTDGTSSILRGFRRGDPAVKVVELSRNFGHQAAITAGLDHASGDACVVMDADGQDPPEVIARMVAAWRDGFEVVHAARTRRDGEGLFKRLTASAFYRLLRGMSDVDMPLDAGDFRLLDRKVLTALLSIRETHRYMRGLSAWVGFKQGRIEYERPARVAGETHYPWWRMARLALDGITGFSHQPLRWVTFAGLMSCVISACIGAWAIYVKFFNPQAVQGWTSLMGVMLFLGGVQLTALGVVGEYLGRVFDEVKRRPLYVVRDSSGFRIESSSSSEARRPVGGRIETEA